MRSATQARPYGYARDVAPALVIGYGNPLRGDDGVGPEVARRLETVAGLRVMTAYQLLPEHATEIAEASAVVLVDAALDLPAGEVRSRRLQPSAGARGLADLHDLSPEGLLVLARELTGAEVPAFIVTVGVADVGLGDGLSPEVEAAVGRAADAVLELLG